MTELMLPPAVAERLASAAGLDRWYKVAERLRDESASEEERLALRWHVVAFDYQLAMPERRPEGGRGPALLPKATFEGGGSYPDPVAQIPEEAVSQWLAAADLVEDPLFRARYRDLLWHRRVGRAGDHARAAAEAYLEIAQDRERFEGLMVITATSRAIELAQVIDARELLAGALAAGVEACNSEMAAEDPKPGVVIRMLAVLDRLPPAHRPAELGDLLSQAEGLYAGDPYLGKDIALMQIANATNGEERVLAAMRQIQRWESANDRGLARLTNLRDAAQFAESQGLGDEARRLRRLVERITPDQLDLQTVSGEFSVPTVEIDGLIGAIVGSDDYLAAIRRLASYGPPSGDPAHTEALVRQIAEDTPFLHLMPQTILGPEGSILRVTRSQEEAIQVGIPRQEATAISLTSFVLADALDRIRDRCGIPDEATLAAGLTTELITEPVARGIARGLIRHHSGDFDAAAHLLVPRVERGIRALARAIGIAVTTPPSGDDPGGVRGLGVLLHDLRGRWPEPWRRYFMNLLVDPFGMNLRNSISHGLIDEADRPTSAILVHAAVHLTLLQPTEAVAANEVGSAPAEASE